MTAPIRAALGVATMALVVAALPGAAQSPLDLVLDYEVPESPGLVALGVAPSNTLRGTAAKPVVATVLNQILSSDRMESGLAVDFSPYAVFGFGPGSVDEYIASRSRRALFNTTVSFATINALAPSDDLRLGGGLRTVLWDSRDPLADRELADFVSGALAAAAVAPGAMVDDEVGEVIDLAERGVDLTAAYRAARARAERTPGFALAVGWGFAAPLAGGVAALDSIGDLHHRVWVAGQLYGNGWPDLMATTQFVSRADDGNGSVRLGVAVRAGGPDYRFALEGMWDTEDGFAPGISASIRALPGIHIAAAIVAERPEAEGPMQIRLRHDVRWNRSEGR